MGCILASCDSISFPWLVFFFAVRAYDSQACEQMDVTRESISRILELREWPLSFQTGFSLVSADVLWAIRVSISGFKPSSVVTEPRDLKLVTVSSFCPFIFIFVFMPLAVSYTHLTLPTTAEV